MTKPNTSTAVGTPELAKLNAETRLAELDATKRELEIMALQRDYDLSMSHAAFGKPLRYLFVGDVDELHVYSAIETLEKWTTRSPDPVLFTISSPGGSLIDGLALYDYLVDLGRRRPVITRALGSAASMAGVLLQAGTTREMAENSYMLIHEASSIAWGKASELEDQYRLTERLQDRIVSILCSKSNLTPDMVRDKWKRRDWWLDASEALAYGLIDGIV